MKKERFSHGPKLPSTAVSSTVRALSCSRRSRCTRAVSQVSGNSDTFCCAALSTTCWARSVSSATTASRASEIQ